MTGLRRALAQAAQGGISNRIRQLPESIQILHGALTGHDALQDLQHPLGALPAGNALAAAFILSEVHEEPGHLHHAGVLVHDHQAAGADHGPHLGEGIKIQWHIQMLCRSGSRRRGRRSGRP